MDTQDIALMLVIGILVIALIVVNTAPIGQIEDSVSTVGVERPVSTKIPVRSTVTTFVAVYDPAARTTTQVEIA